MLKQAIKKRIVSSPLLSRFMEFVAGRQPKIFLYHRFSEPGSKNSRKISADIFQRQLMHIAEKFRVITFGECTEHFLKTGSWPQGCAVITVDDGYRDFYQYAYPELKRLNLPATFFVTVNFVDQKRMLWHDRLHYAIENTTEKFLRICLGRTEKQFLLYNEKEKLIAWKALSDFCIVSEDCVKWELIASIESALGITSSGIAFGDYAPVSWEELCQMSNNSIEIGCHTMTHPILSRIPHNRLHEEIAVSKQILEDKLNKPVCSFCYPNGMPGDINEEVVTAVSNAGYTGAPFGNDLTLWKPYMVPRMGASENDIDFASKLSGLEYAGSLARKMINRYKC